MHLLIAGGTGTSGRVLAERAQTAGHRVRIHLFAAEQRAGVGHHLTMSIVGAARRANDAGVVHPAGGVRGALTFDDWLEEVSSWSQPSQV